MTRESRFHVITCCDYISKEIGEIIGEIKALGSTGTFFPMLCLKCAFKSDPIFSGLGALPLS